MRVTCLVVPILLSASPALAQAPATPPEGLPQEIVDPATAERVGRAMESLSKELLDMKVGGVQAALEGREPTAAERNRTVRDVGRIDDRDLDRRIAEVTPQIQQSMKAFQRSLPELTRSLRQAQESIERAIANMPDPTYPRR